MTKKEVNQKLVSMRDGFGEALVELGEKNKDVVALTADLGESLRMQRFAEKFPDRFFQIGIAEQNMAGIAAGLALSGKVPFAGTFACFQPMRNLDQIRTSICMMNANVKLISSHAGFSYAADGIQIQALEDIAIMRTLPNMTVLVPADADQARQLTLQSADINGPVYLRLGRKETETISQSTLVDKDVLEEVAAGQAQTLTTGSDAVIIACGYMVNLALQAAKALGDNGVHVSVMNMHTIKPLDRDAVLRAAEATAALVTVEEHQKAGGLGAAVAEVLVESDIPCRMRMVGVNDTFGETAKTTEELWQSRGLTVENIVKAVKSVMSS